MSTAADGAELTGKHGRGDNSPERVSTYLKLFESITGISPSKSITGPYLQSLGLPNQNKH